MSTTRWILAALAAFAFAGCDSEAPGGVDVIDGADTEAPTVSFIEPQDGQSVIEGEVLVRIEAEDDTGVVEVQVTVDGEPQVALRQAPFEWLWDTSGLGEGAHTLEATALDAAGNKGAASIQVQLGCEGTGDCPPPLSMQTPQTGDFVRATTEVVLLAETGTAFCPLSGNIEIQVDGIAVGGASLDGDRHVFVWDTTVHPDGVVSLSGVGRDTCGQATRVSIDVAIDNTAPLLGLTAPNEGDVVANALEYAYTAADDLALDIETTLRWEGPRLGELIPESRQGTIDLTDFPSGDYTLILEGSDTAGNQAADQRGFIIDRPPTIAFTSPEPNTLIQGVVVVEADFADDFDLAQLPVLFANDERIGEFDEDGVIVWSPALGAGPVTLRAEIEDIRGQRATAELAVELDRALAIELRLCDPECAPIVDREEVSDTARLEVVLIEGPDDLLRVELEVDGVESGNVFNPPFEFSWDTRQSADGEATLTATATDIEDRVATATAVVTVNNCDRDGDGELAQGACGGADCDDTSPLVRPGADDTVGDSIDQNCDGLDGLDADGDDFASIDSGGRDCDDTDGAVFPCPGDPEGLCADRLTDPFNCGGCGLACDPSLSCAGGDCICPREDCEEGNPEDYDFDASGTFMNDIIIVTDREQGADLDEDGEVDNAFGPMMGNLGQVLGTDVNANLRFLIRTGQLAIGAAWPDMPDGPIGSAEPVTVDFFDLVDTDNNPNTRNAYRVTAGSFIPGFATPRTRFSNGVIADGVLSAGPADGFLITIPFGGIPLSLVIDDARLGGTLSRDNNGVAMADGSVAGVISFRNFVLALNTYLQSDFCSCLGLEEELIDLDVSNGPSACTGQFVTTTCDQRGQQLCSALAQNCGILMLVLPGQMDIDQDDDGRDDAFSVFLQIEGQGTNLLGVAP